MPKLELTEAYRDYQMLKALVLEVTLFEDTVGQQVGFEQTRMARTVTKPASAISQRHETHNFLTSRVSTFATLSVLPLFVSVSHSTLFVTLIGKIIVLSHGFRYDTTM